MTGYYSEMFGFDSLNYYRSRMIEAEEFEVHAHEAVEVLEDQDAQLADLADAYKHLYYGTQEERRAYAEAVEVLEDLLAHEREAGEGFKLAAADYYGQTLDLKAKVRELTAKLSERENISTVFYLNQEKDAHARTKAALRDAEAKIKELHERIEDRRVAVKVILESKNKWADRAIAAERKLANGGRRFEVVGSSVHDTESGRYAPFGAPGSAESAARDFNAGNLRPGIFIWRDNP